MSKLTEKQIQNRWEYILKRRQSNVLKPPTWATIAKELQTDERNLKRFMQKHPLQALKQGI